MVLNLPPDECIDNTQDLVTKKKKKTKETTKRNSNKRSKAKERQRARSLEEEPLGKGNGSTHPRQNHAQAKITDHQTKTRTTQRAPLHICKLPLSQSTLRP
jgi:hypothetical protein